MVGMQRRNSSGCPATKTRKLPQITKERMPSKSMFVMV